MLYYILFHFCHIPHNIFLLVLLNTWFIPHVKRNTYGVIPAQLGKLGAPYVMDFVLLWCIGRYLWEMKNLQILASNSVSFSRSGNLKFRGVDNKNAS